LAVNEERGLGGCDGCGCRGQFRIGDVHAR
jgi:hypothetical protein